MCKKIENIPSGLLINFNTKQIKMELKVLSTIEISASLRRK
jgi:hypothetical protein